MTMMVEQFCSVVAPTVHRRNVTSSSRFTGPVKTGISALLPGASPSLLNPKAKQFLLLSSYGSYGSHVHQ